MSKRKKENERKFWKLKRYVKTPSLVSGNTVGARSAMLHGDVEAQLWIEAIQPGMMVIRVIPKTRGDVYCQEKGPSQYC